MHLSVHIYHIRDGFKGVKRNANGQNQFGPVKALHAAQGQHSIQVFNKKVGVFKVEQQAQIHQQRQGQQGLSLPSFCHGIHKANQVKIKQGCT